MVVVGGGGHESGGVSDGEGEDEGRTLIFQLPYTLTSYLLRKRHQGRLSLLSLDDLRGRRAREEHARDLRESRGWKTEVFGRTLVF